MTFSIAARCERTGMFGLALASSSPAVAARCIHARAGIGAVATQSVTDPRLGPVGLDRLGEGGSASSVLEDLKGLAGDTIAFRQLSVIDAHGRTAAFSGAHALGRHGHITADNAVAAGNMLASDNLPRAMVDAFLVAPHRHIGRRLLDALEAAVATGGEEGPVHAAGLLVVGRHSWPLADLRVDWSDEPIADLAALWTIWEPQIEDYVTRALDPTAAPSYGVPGAP